MGPSRSFRLQSGFSLLEVLITMVILAFGLVGLAGFQLMTQVSETESFQRAQAILLVEDMANRISANRANASSYLTNTTPIGTGDSQPADCTSLTGVAKDSCEWSNELKGAAEKRSGTQAAIGAMTGARGCIEQTGTNPPVYLISVAWQGMRELRSPSLSCGQSLYGSSDGYRRALANRVTIANLSAP